MGEGLAAIVVLALTACGCGIVGAVVGLLMTPSPLSNFVAGAAGFGFLTLLGLMQKD